MRLAVHHVPQTKLAVFKTYPGKNAAIGTKAQAADCLLGWSLKVTQQQPRSGAHVGRAGVNLPDYQSAFSTICEELILCAKSNLTELLAQSMVKRWQLFPRCHLP